MRLLKRFLSYYKPYRLMLVLDLFCAAVVAVVGLLFPQIINHLLRVVFVNPDQSMMIRQISLAAAGLLALYLIEMVAQYVVTSWGHIMGAKMESDMRSDLFSHLEKLSFSYYDQHNTGQLISRLIADLFDITELAHHGPEEVLISLVKLIGTFTILMLVNVPVTLMLLVVVVLMFIFSGRTNRAMHRTFMNNRRRIADVNAIVQDSLSGIRTVKSFSNEEIEQAKFEVGNQNFLASKRENYLVMGRYHSVNGFFQGLMYIVVILAGGWFISRGEMAPTTIVLYVLYINMFLEPIKRIINFSEQFQKGMTGFTRMIEIMDTEPEITDRPGARDAGQLQGDIDFDAVSFRYDEDAEVLTDLTLSIPAGRTVALVGPSGAGKSTFCSLIPRFYEVTAGAVKIDGVDVRDYTLNSLRRNIGVVQQDVYIFNSSVRENIAYGNPRASDEEIREAARLANIDAFIMSLPQGYDTQLGERGVRFSGGQKQRISIARVFLKNPPILILDEATSSLDNESEQAIQEALTELARDRTTIIIAHRLSTIRDADDIIVLTEDGIAERGRHDDLLTLGGTYYQLHQIRDGS